MNGCRYSDLKFMRRTMMLAMPQNGIVTASMSNGQVSSTTFDFSRSASFKTPVKMPRTIVMSGPSGGGKSTILNRAMNEYPNTFAFSVSHTTRKPREGEKDGVHYHFSSKEKVEEMIAKDEFLEYAVFGGNTYGTSKKSVADVTSSGKICVLDLELQGVHSIKKSHLDAKCILIKAPSLQILEERLRARGSETEESLQKRLKHAREDSETVDADPSLFDYIVVNDDLDSAYRQFINAISEDIAAVCAMSSASGRRLPPLPALRDFIHLYSLRAKKILSQNYLMDMNLTRKIVRHAGVQPGGVAAEVGPGPGGISRAILEAGVERLDVVEIDSRFIPSLQHLSEAAEDRLHIHRADILKTCIGHIWRAAGVGGACDRATDEPLCGDAQEMRFSKHFRPWLEDSPELNIIGNLPFNIATPLIIKFIREISYRAGPWSFGRVPLTLTFQVVEKFVRQVFHYRQKYIVKGLMTLYPDGMAKDAAHEVIREVRVSPTTTSIRVGLEEYAEMGAVYERHCREHPGLFLYDYTKPAKGGLAELATKKNAVPVPYPFQSYQLPPEGVSLHQFDVLLKQGLIS